MKDLSIGQVLSLKIRFNNHGDISKSKHPYLIVEIDTSLNVVEIAQLDSLAGKEFKASMKTNKIIDCDNPDETVIDKDSYVQLDNSFQLQYFDDLSKYRRQPDRLSHDKLHEVLRAYKDYHETHEISDDKIVFMTQVEIEKLNS